MERADFMGKGADYLREVEELENIIRKLKRQLDQLRKQIRRRPEVSEENKHEKYEKKKFELRDVVNCPKCGKAEGYSKVKIANRTIITCTICNTRRVEIDDKRFAKAA